MSTTVEATRVMHFMDETGHTSFGWDPDDDQWVLPMIRAKMGQGFVFWMVKRNPLREVRVERVEDLAGNRHVIIRDDSARDLFERGRIGIVTTDEADLETTGRATSPEEVVRGETVAHRPMRGG